MKEHAWKIADDARRLAAGWGRRLVPGGPPAVMPGKKPPPKPKVNEARRNMWLNELQIGFTPVEKPIPPGVFNSPYGFKKALQKRGFTQLGSGCFSYVLAKKDSDRVIKVNYNPDNWIDYCYWAAENGWAGKYAPKVYSCKKYPAGFAVAVMERMEKPCRSSYKDEEYIIQCLLWPAMHGNNMAQIYLDDYSPGLPKFLLDLGSKWKDSRLDLHGDNMMFRKDGSFCVTDPLAGRSTMTKTRLRSKDFGPTPVRIYYETCEICSRP